jgi:GT2 family glycosyltransferase
MAPIVTVVVAVRNEEANIEKCLNSILSSNLPRDEFEIIVVDGESLDSTVETAKKFPVRLLGNPKRSASAGRNIGFGGARSDLVAFTDGDCEVERNWLPRLVQAIQSAESRVAGAGGPLYTPLNSGKLEKMVGLAQATFLGSGMSVQGFVFNAPRFVESISNSNALYRKGVLIGVGGFDERFGKGQDAELNYRLKKDGESLFLYVPDAIVFHHRRKTARGIWIQYFEYGMGMAHVTRKHRRIPRWFAPLPTLSLVAFASICGLTIAHSSLLPLTLVVLGVYVAALFGTVVESLMRSQTWMSVGCLAILPLQHISYAVGYFVGLLKP